LRYASGQTYIQPDIHKYEHVRAQYFVTLSQQSNNDVVMISFYAPQIVARIDTTTTYTIENDLSKKEKNE